MNLGPAISAVIFCGHVRVRENQSAVDNVKCRVL